MWTACSNFFKVLVVCSVWVLASSELYEGDRCLDGYTNTFARCKRVDECKSAREDFQFNGVQPTLCSYSAATAIVCCRDGVSILNTTPQSQKTSNDVNGPVWTPSKSDNAQRRISERKCEEFSRSVTRSAEIIALLPDPEPQTFSSAACSYDSVKLIVGGQSADVGEFPHMAALGWPVTGGSIEIKCGGTLISEKFVLTAGHCTNAGRDTRVTNLEPTVVRLGDHNINPAVEDGANPVEVGVKKIHRHPDYKPPMRYNDIALLELATAVELNTNVRPACLWSRFDFGDSTKAVATGWGVTNSATGKTSDVLQKVSLDLLDTQQCDNLLYPDRNRNWLGFRPSQMCAGSLGGGKDTCYGDSGGPLQLTSPDNHCIFYIVGLTSFGSNKCAAASQPAVYTRVSHYLSWIESVVWPDDI